jgi:hypothetical protein
MKREREMKHEYHKGAGARKNFETTMGKLFGNNILDAQ